MKIPVKCECGETVLAAIHPAWKRANGSSLKSPTDPLRRDAPHLDTACTCARIIRTWNQSDEDLRVKAKDWGVSVVILLGAAAFIAFEVWHYATAKG